MEVHFIAIGGSVMHQLAIALKQKGYTVTGSDDEIFEPARTNLLKEGLLPTEIGWFPEKIHKRLDAIILGMHARNDNPELVKARDLGIQIYSFPEYIYQESINKTRVVVGGSHGKTTTTAMIMHVLRAAGNNFDYLVGARLDGFDQSVQITSAPLIVCEGDEYPASPLEKRPKFHFLFPNIAILTGIAWDHINVFPTFEIYLEQFRIFIRKIEPNGVLIYNETDPTLKELVESEERDDIRYVPYGIPKHRIANGKTEAHFGDHAALLQVFGDHNLLNMNAAYLACKELEVDTDEFCKHIGSFKGAAKRLELLASNETVSIFRDFAHAPSKLKATIQAVKQQFPKRKLVAVFELHTYSSLNEQFMKEYAGSMDQADYAVVYYSKHALEIKRLPDLSHEKIKEGFGKSGLVVINDPATLMDWLNKVTYRDTNLLLMSSGNYDGSDILNFAQRVVR
jgi:UDP-N-acetylmuramate: L-alanyl-gamma-D-glutamyl-meso-diaminopimelate ligase